MFGFKYTCRCESKKHILLNKLNDSAEVIQLDKALNQLADSAWDDEDEEADELLASVLQTMKGEAPGVTEEDIQDMLSPKIATQIGLVLTNLTYERANCHCREVTHKLSVLVNYGFAELQSRKDTNEKQLLEVLQQIEPFVGVFQKDRNMDSFLQSIWNYCLHTGKQALISKLMLISAREVTHLVDKILNADLVDADSLLEEPNFNNLAQIITVPEVFRHVSLYLAQKDSILPSKAQILLRAVLKTAKARLPKSEFIDLYSPGLRPVVAILNGIINPDDPLVLYLLENVKNECFLDFVILVTHFPLFLHLK